MVYNILARVRVSLCVCEVAKDHAKTSNYHRGTSHGVQSSATCIFNAS